MRIDALEISERQLIISCIVVKLFIAGVLNLRRFLFKF